MPKPVPKPAKPERDSKASCDNEAKCHGAAPAQLQRQEVINSTPQTNTLEHHVASNTTSDNEANIRDSDAPTDTTVQPTHRSILKTVRIVEPPKRKLNKRDQATDEEEFDFIEENSVDENDDEDYSPPLKKKPKHGHRIILKVGGGQNDGDQTVEEVEDLAAWRGGKWPLVEAPFACHSCILANEPCLLFKKPKRGRARRVCSGCNKRKRKCCHLHGRRITSQPYIEDEIDSDIGAPRKKSTKGKQKAKAESDEEMNKMTWERSE